MDCFDENCFDKTEKLKCEIYAEYFVFLFFVFDADLCN